jgi:hypothetical protein
MVGIDDVHLMPFLTQLSVQLVSCTRHWAFNIGTKGLRRYKIWIAFIWLRIGKSNGHL